MGQIFIDGIGVVNIEGDIPNEREQSALLNLMGISVATGAGPTGRGLAGRDPRGGEGPGGGSFCKGGGKEPGMHGRKRACRAAESRLVSMDDLYRSTCAGV